MICKRRRQRSNLPSGYYRFESSTRTRLQGHGEGELVQLRDDCGNVWQGQAERGPDQTIRYRFCDEQGNSISGISDRFGIVLRDEHGQLWRGSLA